MATIEDTLHMHEELIKSIEKQQKALDSSLLWFGQTCLNSASALANLTIPISKILTAPGASTLVNATSILNGINAHSASALANMTISASKTVDVSGLSSLSNTASILREMYAHSASALADMTIPASKIFDVPSVSALSNVASILNGMYAHSASALTDMTIPISKVMGILDPEILKTVTQNASTSANINPIFQDIASDYKLFNEAGLFPKSQDLPHFIDLSSSYDDEKIETLNSELANLKKITDSDSEKIFQQTKSLSEAIQYDIIINTHTRKKKKLKRKVSIRNAHVIRQRYKSKQLKSLYDSLLSYSSKLNKENCYFFITVLNTIIGLPIPDKAKWFFAILLSPILYKAYVLSNHQTVLNEKQNTLEEQQK